MFLNLLPVILVVLILVSIFLFFLPNEIIVLYLGNDAGFIGYLIAAIIGSIALIPGFIAYPLAGILLKNGVSYPVIATFITTLMMVGVLTLPIEIKYFGVRTAILRNVLYFVGTIFIGIFIGLFYNI
ncbi:MAG: permease [Ignavibacteria bacterium]